MALVMFRSFLKTIFCAEKYENDGVFTSTSSKEAYFFNF